jgi:hypothetical protein
MAPYTRCMRRDPTHNASCWRRGIMGVRMSAALQARPFDSNLTVLDTALTKGSGSTVERRVRSAS